MFPLSARAPVIVIDLQTAMFDGVQGPPLYQADALVEKVRRITAWARRQGRPVCFVRHDSDEPGDPLRPGEAGWPVWPELGQEASEPTFSKYVGDAFSAPELVRWVEASGSREVVLLGAQTEYCVTATTEGALARGLTPVVVADAHSTWDSPAETAQAIIARQNAHFRESGARLVQTEELLSP